MFQRHRERIDSLRKHIERDPYEALFGWSNRRINALWDRSSFAALKAEMDGLFPERASLHSNATPCTGNTGTSRRIPIRTGEKIEQNESSSSAAARSSIQGSVSWRTSSTDSAGRTHEESGSLVYDPVSNRMVPRDVPSVNDTPSVIGQKLHAQAEEGRDTSTSQYARPSVNAPTETAMPHASNSHATDSSNNIELGTKGSENAPSLEPLSTSNNEQIRRRVFHISTVRDVGRPVTSSKISDALSTQDVSSNHQQARSNDERPFIDPSKPSMKSIPNEQHLGSTHLESSLDRHAVKATNRSFEQNHRLSSRSSAFNKQNQGNDAELHSVHHSSDQHLRRKHDMEQSWRREHDVPLAKLDKRPGETWNEVQPVQSHRVKAGSEYRNGSEIGSAASSIPRNDFHKAEPAQVSNSSRVHPPAKSSSWESISGMQRASISAYRKQKPLKALNRHELTEHRQRLLKELARRRSQIDRPDAASTKMEAEVSAVKSAFNAFQSKRNQTESIAAQGNMAGSTHDPAQATKSSEAVEMTAAEGDMNPNVVSFAENSRWYKDKAPHAKLASEEVQAKDRQLVNDIRNVYERTYGPINSEHKQGQPLPQKDEVEDVTRDRERKVGFAPSASTSSKARPEESRKPSEAPINPIDKTTIPASDLIPETGNFASPTGFVNHDRPQLDEATVDALVNQAKSQPDTLSSPRRVRREEPVFSGQLSTQKYTVSEVVEILKKQGVLGARDSKAKSAGRNRSRPQSSARSATGSDDSNGTKQLLRYTLLGGGLGAAICYAIGLTVEYAREPLIEGGYDQGRPTWDGQRSWRGQKKTSSSPKAASPAHESRGGKAVRFADMPLRGFEYPMMGLLVACIWYILSSGGS